MKSALFVYTGKLFITTFDLETSDLPIENINKRRYVCQLLSLYPFTFPPYPFLFANQACTEKILALIVLQVPMLCYIYISMQCRRLRTQHAQSLEYRGERN